MARLIRSLRLNRMVVKWLRQIQFGLEASRKEIRNESDHVGEGFTGIDSSVCKSKPDLTDLVHNLIH